MTEPTNIPYHNIQKAAVTGVNNVGCVTKKWKSSEVRVTGKMSQKSKVWEGFGQLISCQ